MSASVISGLAPAGKPHPATKWSLLMAFLVVVVLGVPNFAAAGQPSVQPPTGPSSGGSFTGTYTFVTNIYCTSGLNFNSSYSNSLDGTHTFDFVGAADGSLLVKIDGGGMQLLTSCGDPFTPPHIIVNSYSVSKGVAPPPTPTPTPPPTATPTPTPGGGGGGSGGGSSSGGNSAGASSGGGTAAASTGAGSSSSKPQSGSSSTGGGPSSPSGSATGTAQPPSSSGGRSASGNLPASVGSKITGTASSVARQASLGLHLKAGWVALGLLLGLILALAISVWRVAWLRHWAGSASTRVRIRLEPYWFRLKQSFKQRIRGRDIPKRRGLSAHEHTGKVLDHHHTSYPALAFLLMLSAVLTAGVSLSSRADSSQLSLTVLGPAPSVGATIDQPVGGTRFSTNMQTIRGTCPSGLLVEIYRNGVFAGSAQCDVNSLYSVLITLTDGQNDLVARDLDALGQYGPDSSMVTIFYDAPPAPPSPSPSPAPAATPGPITAATPTPKPASGGKTGKAPSPTPNASAAPRPDPLLIESDRHYAQGGSVGSPVSWTVSVRGGRAPYQLSWQWGDGEFSTNSLDQAGQAQQSHTYVKPGIYQVTIRTKDGLGQFAVMQVVVVINGAVAAPASTGGDSGTLIYIWPLFGFTSLVVFSLWLGERHKLALARAAPVSA